ncbi:MAG: glycosyltransferase family 4 protein [Chloroflexi bacterium]|nr:glycosyltransferase family 4 protein [Chloroflexota bacterium]
MRIAIDATSMPPQPAGAGIYAMELVRAMAEHDRRDGYALFVRGDSLDAALDGRRNWRVEHVGASSRPARLAWEQLQLPRALASLGIDVLHSTHHTLPLAGVRCGRVVTIHDVTFFRIPERYPAARRLYMQVLTRLSAKVADAIIVPSNAVRDDVVRTLRVPAAKVTTVYEAAGPQFAPVERDVALAVARRHGIDAPYVLSVGSLEPGKNRTRLIRAMRRLRDEGLDYRLVVVGQKAWKYESDLDLVGQLGMSDRVIFPGYVRQDDLPALYGGATAFAFPSLYEGFGLPVIEAMAGGVPVVTSNISATAEVAGDAALLVDPLSVDAIAGGLRHLLTDGELRADFARRGLDRAAEFSWRRAADETHAVYVRVAAGGAVR